MLRTKIYFKMWRRMMKCIVFAHSERIGCICMAIHFKQVLSGILAACVLFSLTACGNSQSTSSSTASAASSGSSSQVAAGDSQAFCVSTTELKGTGDKVDFPWEKMTIIPGLMYRTLFLAESDLTTLKPDLASDYSVSEDGLVYTVNFIGGSKWSDGEPITPEDVAFSVKTNLRVAVSNGIYTTAFGKIEGAQEWKDGTADDLAGLTVDGNTITFKLTEPHNSFAQVLAQFAILPEHCLADVDPLELNTDDFWSNPVCSGMYRLDEMVPGSYYTLVPNENYDGAQPKIQKLISYFVSDYVTAAQSGQVDYLATNATDVINELNKLDYMQANPVDILFYRYFVCNMAGTDGNENPVMQNPKVREALMYAIDRETLADQLFPELAYAINSGVPSSDAASNGVKYEYNPEKAKQLLDEAGYDYNYTFRIMYYYSDQASIDFMEAVAYYLGEIGMKVELTQSSQGTQDMFQTRDYDIAYKGLSAFDLSEWYGEYQSGNANFQNIFGGDDSFDALISDLLSSTTQEEKNETLKQLQDLEQEKMYKLPLYTIGNLVYINTDHVKVPEGTTFGNPLYRFDMGFENWELNA